MSKGRRAKKRQARLLRRRGIETGAAFWWGRRLVLVCGTDGPRRVLVCDAVPALEDGSLDAGRRAGVRSAPAWWFRPARTPWHAGSIRPRVGRGGRKDAAQAWAAVARALEGIAAHLAWFRARRGDDDPPQPSLLAVAVQARQAERDAEAQARRPVSR